MNTAEAQLSSELQELYLENKETLSDILFLEVESRFLEKLVEKVLLSSLKEEKIKEIEFVNSNLVELQDRRDKLKILLSSQQHSIENMLKAADMVIEMSLLNHNTFITKEIKALLRADMLIKQELYAMVEQVMAERKSGHLLLS
ncbi:MAG: hypothetical protein V4708_09390 [Bacteroidota bacterium]